MRIYNMSATQNLDVDMLMVHHSDSLENYIGP